MVVATTQKSAEYEVGGRRSGFSLGFLSLQPLAALADIGLLALAGVLSQFLYAMPTPTASEMIGVVVIATTIFVSLSYLTGSYQDKAVSTRWGNIWAAWRLWAITICFLALGGFLLKIGSQFSRGSVVLFIVIGALLIAGARAIWPFIVSMAVERGLIFVTRVLLLRIHSGLPSERELEGLDLDDLRRTGLHPVAVHAVSLQEDADHWSRMLDIVRDELRLGRIEEVVLLADGDSLRAVEQVVERLRIFPIPVRLVLDPSVRRLLDRNLRRAGTCVLAEYQRAPLGISERFLKRSLDVSLALCGLLLLSPLFVLTAIAIRIDTRGPVLFRQSRRGFGGRPFTILKFRSMTVADNGAHVVQAKRNDIRVTRVGRVIRRTSIDELPQLLNVLQGHMSIVGPRPHAVAHDDYYARFIEEYAFRHHSKPGLTGWAQVHGLRGETPHIENMQARIEKDIWYIDNWSIWLDVAIIVRTVFAVLNQKTAY